MRTGPGRDADYRYRDAGSQIKGRGMVGRVKLVACMAAVAMLVAIAERMEASCGSLGTCDVGTTTYYCDRECLTATGCDVNLSHSSCDELCDDELCVICMRQPSTTDPVDLTVQGTNGDDVICDGTGGFIGNAGDDSINAKGGADIIDAGWGNDGIDAGGGADVVYGGPNFEPLDDRQDKDTVEGSGGEDEIYGGFDSDTIMGGDGDDTINGQLGNDTIYGDGGEDEILDEDGNNTVYGGADDDQIVVGYGDDVIHGDAGADVLYDGGGRGVVRGGAGNDVMLSWIFGQPLPPDDTVGILWCGDDGNDTIAAIGPSHQCLDGGDGTDGCNYTYVVVGGRTQTSFDLATNNRCESGQTGEDVPCGCD
jgi:hypothetical protein